MADTRTKAEKLAAMAASVESPHEAEIARRKLGSAKGSPPNATSPKRGADGDVVLVFVDGQPEEAEVDDYGPFAG